MNCAKCGMQIHSYITINGLHVCDWCTPRGPQYITRETLSALENKLEQTLKESENQLKQIDLLKIKLAVATEMLQECLVTGGIFKNKESK